MSSACYCSSPAKEEITGGGGGGGGDVYSNYKSVSNIASLSMVIERVVVQRLNSHMDVNHMHEAMQSAYKKHHITETALLYIIQNVIFNSNDRHKVVVLVLLDLSAAFEWYRSYL